MIESAPDRPWMPERSRSCVRGRLLVKVAAGESPSSIPHYLQVAAGARPAPTRFDGGPIDGVLRRHSPAVRISRAFVSARGGGEREDWDNVEVATGLSRTYRIEIDPSASVLRAVAELRELGVVEAASPQYLGVTPFADPKVSRPSERLYAHRMIGLDRALAFEPGDGALIVAVVDSGVSLRHREFSGRLRPGVDCVDLPPRQVSRGITLLGDTTRPDRDPDDQMGHGTACASIIAARGDRIPPGAGGAVRLLPARALAAARLAEKTSLTAIGALPDIDHAVKLAVDLGARILNLSFGTPEGSLREDDPRPHQDVIEYALQRGCILVAASGNSGGATRYFPAAHPGVIAVGSVGEAGAPSSFSTRGGHVDLSAPGEHIPSAALDGYQTNTGTSFAAPFVAGACALLIARAARYGVPMDRETAREFLTTYARPFGADVDAEGCGAGVLDMPATLHGLERALALVDAQSQPLRPRSAAA